jgi:hypothetical protein
VQSRIRLRVEFDQPHAELLPRPADVDPETWAPESWAVTLNIKTRLPDVNDNPPSWIPVTCQFNRRLSGVRLNTPMSEQRDEAKVMLSLPRMTLSPDALDYGSLGGKRFTLEHTYGGYNIDTLGHSAGCGSLQISGVGSDQRVFSQTGLAAAPSIGAVGITLATIDGIGRMSVRLRNFSVEVWQ